MFSEVKVTEILLYGECFCKEFVFQQWKLVDMFKKYQIWNIPMH